MQIDDVNGEIECQEKECTCRGNAEVSFTIMGNTFYVCYNCLQMMFAMCKKFNRYDWV